MSERAYRITQLVIVVVGLQLPMYLLAKEIGDDEAAKTTFGLILSFIGLIALGVAYKWSTLLAWIQSFKIVRPSTDDTKTDEERPDGR